MMLAWVSGTLVQLQYFHIVRLSALWTINRYKHSHKHTNAHMYTIDPYEGNKNELWPLFGIAMKIG